MSERSQNLLAIRPSFAMTTLSDSMSFDEWFQNKTLRPVIKLQNDLLLVAFKNYIKKHKDTFHELGPEKKLTYIENAIQKDVKFRNSLKGMLIGQFTLEEYAQYITNSSALNKRMMNMVIERLKDQIQFFGQAAIAV